ncbi:MAG: DUF2203 domain-containing protein [Nanoarchaeota archaeon]|nr:DUF2203 domain-containing protein [Nanoarchaeota archaeon]
MAKIFTLSEANSLIPQLADSLEKISGVNERISGLTADIRLLFDIWGNEVTEQKNVDHHLYTTKIREREEAARTLQGHVEEIQKTGAIVKDVHTGLIDFYHEKDGNTVFLCWKHGEQKIAHWHGVTEGFSNRKTLELLDVRKHFA